MKPDPLLRADAALLHKAAFFPEPYSGATIVRLMLSKALS